MSFFDDVGNFFSGAVSGTLSGVKNLFLGPVHLTSDIVSGKNVLQSVGSAAATSTAALTAPVDVAAQRSGLNTAISRVPLVGGIVSTYSNNAADVTTQGYATPGQMLAMGRSAAEAGAIAAGGYFAAPAVGAYASSLGGLATGATTLDLAGTAELAGAGIAASSIGAKLIKGQPPSLSDLAAANGALGDPTGLGGILPVGSDGASSAGASTPRSFVGPVQPTGGLMGPTAVPLGNQSLNPGFVALLGLGSYLAIHAIRKGH